MSPIVLINPNLVVQRNDPFTTGIVYMPIGMAYTAATLREADYDVRVIDAYAEAPRNARREGKFTLFGLSESQVLARIPADAQMVFLYAINLTNHISSMGIIRALKESRPKLPIIVIENTQAVTAYALSEVKDELFEAGADYFLSGEPDQRAVKLANIIHLQVLSKIWMYCLFLRGIFSLWRTTGRCDSLMDLYQLIVIYRY